MLNSSSEHFRARSPSWKWWVCGLLLLATMINYMDRLTLNLTAKRIRDYLLLSHEQYGQVESVFGIAFAAGALAWGWAADRWNTRGLYALALLAWSAAGFATGFAQTFWALLVCRFCLGLFESGNWPCALRTTQRILTPRQRVMGNGILQSGAAIGAILTPLIVLLLVTGNGSSWLPEFVSAPQQQVRAEHLAVFAPVPVHGFPGNFPWAGVFLGSQEGSWRYPFLVIGAMGTVWVLLWLFVVRPRDLALPGLNGPAAPTALLKDRRHEASLWGLYRDARFWVLVTLVVSINLTWHFFRVWLPLFLQEKHGYSEEAVNYFMMTYYIATDAGSLTAGFGTLLLARRGVPVHTSRIVVFLACALLTLLSLVVARLPTGPVLLALLLVLGFGALGLFPVYYSLNQELTVRHQGKLTGILGCSTWLASALMHPLVGQWVDRTKDYSAAVGLAGVFPVIGWAALVLFWGRAK
jgi:ACS family hexuronate transporter-like MFS transporter